MTRAPARFRPALLAAVAVLPVLLAGCFTAAGPDADPAPGFALTTTSGANVTLADYRGQVLVIDMMATWCAPCKEAMPAFREYLAAHPDDPVTILSLDVDPTEWKDGADPLPGFMREYNATWPAAYDTDDVFRKYRAHGIPTLVVVDADGRLREKLQLSRVTPASLESLLAPYVAEARERGDDAGESVTQDADSVLAGSLVPVTGAFLAGMLAFFSPCGFPMLPAFMAYYLNQETTRAAGTSAPRPHVLKRTARGLTGGVVAALGAALVLASVAVAAIAIGTPFKEHVLLLELVGGLVVLVLGVLLLAGKDVLSFTPRVTASERRGATGLFTFGALYAAVGAGCVAPVFIGIVVQALAAPSALATAAILGAYGLGFGLLLIGVTTVVGFAGAGVVHRLNAVLPYVKRVSGVILVLVGLYLVAYWYTIEVCLLNPGGALCEIAHVITDPLGRGR